MLSLVHTASQSCCQPWKDSYNTNSPRTSLMTTESIHTRVCVAVYTSRSDNPRGMFISLSASDCVATIWGWRLFEGSDYSKKYSKYSVVYFDQVHRAVSLNLYEGWGSYAVCGHMNHLSSNYESHPRTHEVQTFKQILHVAISVWKVETDSVKATRSHKHCWNFHFSWSFCK